MAFFDTVKSGFTTAVDTVSSVTQTIVEKNRANAQLNRLRAVMKSECEMINRAYITLGKNYYENKINGKNDACPNEEELFEVIQQSKENIKKARERYRQVIESRAVELVAEYDIQELEDITVSCSNEKDYGESPFADVSDTDNEVAEEKEPADVVADVIEKAKINAEKIADEADDNLEDEVENSEENEEIAKDTQELF